MSEYDDIVERINELENRVKKLEKTINLLKLMLDIQKKYKRPYEDDQFIWRYEITFR